MWTAGLGYLGLVLLLTWQALRGHSVTSPDLLTLGALFALFAAVSAFAFALILRARRAR